MKPLSNTQHEEPATSKASQASAATPVWTEPGTPAYRRIVFALFLAGFVTFTLLYCVQPLLPMLAKEFHVSPAQSSLALSLSTGCLALAILGAGAISESMNRRWLMFGSMGLASVLSLAAAILPGWHTLLILRTLVGLSLGGIPAVALAYLAEEIHPRGQGSAIGLYVGGTAIGGMAGRIGTSFIADYFSWRTALISLSVINLLAAIGFVLLLPASRNFVRRKGFEMAHHLGVWRAHLTHAGLPCLFMMGCLTMGVFVTIFNYVAFRLMTPQFGLTPSQIGLIFTAYLFGSAASSLAGNLVDRFGQAPVLVGGTATIALGVALTLLNSLTGVIFGIVILTGGFFGTHAVASSWVGRMAERNKGHATSLYLLAYYLGSSIVGSSGGWFWQHGGWPAVVELALALLTIAMILALYLRNLAETGRCVSAANNLALR